MKYKVIGVQRQAGDFKDDRSGNKISYDNIVLHCIGHDSRVVGQSVEALKLKTVNYGAALCGASGASLSPEANSLAPLVGCTVDIDRDSRGYICDVAVVSRPDAKVTK